MINNGINDRFKQPKQEYLKQAVNEYNLPEKYIFSLGKATPMKNVKGLFETYELFSVLSKYLGVEEQGN